MKTLIDEFGQNAGKVWQVLNAHGPLKEEALLKTTRLNQDDLWAAIGWLARENKIVKKTTCINLEPRISHQRSARTQARSGIPLQNRGKLILQPSHKPRKSPRLTRYCALGWLARENKIVAKKIRAKENQLKVALKK